MVNRPQITLHRLADPRAEVSHGSFCKNVVGCMDLRMALDEVPVLWNLVSCAQQDIFLNNKCQCLCSASMSLELSVHLQTVIESLHSMVVCFNGLHCVQLEAGVDVALEITADKLQQHRCTFANCRC